MKHKHIDKYTLMTTAPIPRLIGSLAIPTIVSMLVTSFYVMIDTYFVGKINTQATAAVGISFSVMAIIQAFGFFFGHGSGKFHLAPVGSARLSKRRENGGNGILQRLHHGMPHHAFRALVPDPYLPHTGLYPHYPALYRDLSGHHPAGERPSWHRRWC